MKVSTWIINNGINKFKVIAPSKTLALLKFKDENTKDFVKADFIKIAKIRKSNKT